MLSRTLPAPRALVCRVWTDPTLVARWWGPDGFTNTTRAMEVRPGNDWRRPVDPEGPRDRPASVPVR